MNSPRIEEAEGLTSFESKTATTARGISKHGVVGEQKWSRNADAPALRSIGIPGTDERTEEAAEDLTSFETKTATTRARGIGKHGVVGEQNWSRNADAPSLRSIGS